MDVIAPHMKRENTPLLFPCERDDRIADHLSSRFVKNIWRLNHRVRCGPLAVDIVFTRCSFEYLLALLFRTV